MLNSEPLLFHTPSLRMYEVPEAIYCYKGRLLQSQETSQLRWGTAD